MSTYYGILTQVGAAKEANSHALGIPLNIAEMAVGDGGGALLTPNAAQTALIGQKHRAPLNRLFVDPNNPNWIVAEQVIPETVGGWWIRELGLYDDDDNLIAVANCPPTYKPQLSEGSGRTQVVRMVLLVSSADNFTLKIDPSVVLATRGYVDEGLSTKAALAHTHAWDEVTEKPIAFPPVSHSHEIADVLGLTTALGDKSALVHSHDITQINGALGNGQTWQIKTSERTWNVTYTNTTGRPILVVINKGNGMTLGYFYIDGLNFGESQSLQGSYMTFLVPDGSTYRYTQLFGCWAEFR